MTTSRGIELSATIHPDEDRGGIVVALALGGGEDVAISPIWTIGGWVIRFARLAPGARYEFDAGLGDRHVMILCGVLTTPDRRPFADPRSVRDTHVSESTLVAGGEGATLAILIETPEVRDRISSMAQLSFSGPHSNRLTWASFEQRFGRFTDVFDGLDAHLAPGFHVRDDTGREMVYVHFWTAGKDVDCSTHDHSHAPSQEAPAFAEVHWVFQNGTGRGAMYECAGPGAPHRSTLPVLRGYEHGPFWSIDPRTGLPKQRSNGAVEYGFHGWQAGADDHPGQSFDFVAAFEFAPAYARVAARPARGA